MHQKALLVIDMDHANGWAPESFKISSSIHVIQSLQSRLHKWRHQNEGIIGFVMFPGTTGVMRNMFADCEVQFKLLCDKSVFPEHGNTGCVGCDAPFNKRLASFLEHQHTPFEPVFIKYSLDAFRNKHLAPFLRTHGVEEVALAGCLTEECIECTAAGALKEGFHVTLLGDCVDYPVTSSESKQEWVRWMRAVEKPAPHLSVRVE